MLSHLERLRFVVLLLAVITFVKIALFLVATSLGVFGPFIGGGATLHHLPGAKHFLELGTYNSPETSWLAQKPPGYSALIALIQSISSEHWAVLLVAVQMLFDLLTAATIWFLGREFGMARAGAAAGIGWLLFPPAALVSTWVAPASVFTFLLTGAITLLLLSIRNARLPAAFAAGVAIGVATMVRAAPMAFPLLFMLAAMFKPFPRARSIGVLAVIGTALVITPWAIRNKIVLKENIPVRYGVGMVFMQGSQEASWDLSRRMTPEGYPTLFRNAEAAGVVKPTDGRVTSQDRWMFNVGVRSYITRARERPWSFVPFAFHKFMRLWYGIESCNETKQWALGLFSLFVVPLGLIQIVQWRRTQRELAWVLGLVTIYFAAIHFVLLAQVRYILPTYPLIMLGTGTLALRHAHLFTAPGESLATAARSIRERVGGLLEPGYAALRDDTGTAELTGSKDEDVEKPRDGRS